MLSYWMQIREPEMQTMVIKKKKKREKEKKKKKKNGDF